MSLRPCQECGTLSTNPLFCSNACRGAARVRENKPRQDRIRARRLAGVSIEEIAADEGLAPSSIKRYLEIRRTS